MVPITWGIVNKFLKGYDISKYEYSIDYYPHEKKEMVSSHMLDVWQKCVGKNAPKTNRVISHSIGEYIFSDLLDFETSDGEIGRFLFTGQDITRFSTKRIWWLAWLLQKNVYSGNLYAIKSVNPLVYSTVEVFINADKIAYIESKMYNLINKYGYMFMEE